MGRLLWTLNIHELTSARTTDSSRPGSAPPGPGQSPVPLEMTWSVAPQIGLLLLCSLHPPRCLVKSLESCLEPGTQTCSQDQGYLVPSRNLHKYDLPKSRVSLFIDALEQKLRDIHIRSEERGLQLYSPISSESKLHRDEVLSFPWISWVP
uniref:Uncharacterized protein n=1 Tax=Myotis myotis TaxID=51298 RepID=A0A7J7Z5P4_MYOMY|nr:hypothetical protein mMyoMyo1_010748 [Myotis myotis]